MKKYRAALQVLAGVVCVGLLTIAGFAADNFSGTWKLNLQKSQFNPGPPPRSLTSTLAIMGDTANFTFDGYDSNGESIVPEELSRASRTSPSSTGYVSWRFTNPRCNPSPTSHGARVPSLYRGVYNPINDSNCVCRLSNQ